MKLTHVPIFLTIALGLPLYLAAMIPRFAFAAPPLTPLGGSMAAAAAHSGIPAASVAPPLPRAPIPGVWTEISVVVDGVNVRKIRDTTGGDYNVCYIASRQTSLSPYGLNTEPAMLSISCVPEKRP